ncbi:MULTISPECIES: hypothetical protein [Priestia]|uniref:Uncharacterized protein n=1 Tax=Priestia megaterium (strain ATCC 12872 / QMB1551) TaxID=545693 RepID=D5E4I8_PRIM1|nr:MULTISPECIES: hypothetical protein [Priestia]ADE72713.1 hypothetical protein BMQ_pBM70173 [Priestia megaterium QM B1551]
MNIKIIYTIAGIIVLGLILIIPITIIGSSQIEKYSYYKAESVNLSKENLNGIKIDEDFEKIKKNIKDLNDKSDNWFTYKDGTRVKVSKKNIVNSVSTESNNTVTQKKVGLNSSFKEITSLYGEKYYKREEQSFEIIGYPDKKLKINLEFWFLNDKLEKILLVKK